VIIENITILANDERWSIGMGFWFGFRREWRMASKIPVATGRVE
jgi:hypothetical protein